MITRRNEYHEAGHAVTWWVLLGDAGGIEIRYDEQSIAFRPSRDEYDPQRYLEAHQIACLAGPIAQAYRMGERIDSIYRTSGATDVRQFFRLCFEARSPNAVEELSSCQKRASELLISQWHMVKRLADALYERPIVDERAVLSADDVRGILGN